MTAIVGKFTPGALTYRARPVDLEGQPNWLLGQMWCMWQRTFARDTYRMCATLLRHDWSVLANTAWPPPLVDDPKRFTYVTGVGRANRGPGSTLGGHMPADAPRDGEQWAYLWEHAGGALHVYRSAFERWHHLATLPVAVFATLTPQLVADIEERQDWLDRAV